MEANSEDLEKRLAYLFSSAMKGITGRGPDHVEVYVNRGRVITIIAEQTLTQAELALAGEDRDLAYATRRTLQGLIRESTAGAFGQETGQSVLAALSDHAIEPDLAAYVFVIGER